jgi:hypothetical protein
MTTKLKNIMTAILSIFFCASYMLIPIERGFPEINLKITSVGLTTLLTILVFLFFLIFFYKDIKKEILGKNYIFRQGLFISILFLSACIQPQLNMRSLSATISIGVTFILLYLDISILFICNKKIFLNAYFIVASAALLIGLAEGITKKYIPFYLDMFVKYDGAAYVANYFKDAGFFRVIGTLGHPILYSILLASSIPIVVTQAKNKYFKIIYCILALLTIFLSKSTTGFLMLLALVFGFLIVKNERKYYIAFFIILLVIGGFFIILPDYQFHIGKSLLSLKRIFFGDPGSTTERIRQIQWAIGNFKSNGLLHAIFGQGTGMSVQNITKSLGRLSGFSTDVRSIDNVFFTLLYDNGLLGLGAYIFAFIAPLFTTYKKYSDKYLWWAILSFLLAGISTDTYFYSTINFTFVLTWLLMEELPKNEQVLSVVQNEN